MQTINRDNYEEYFLLYVDNELDAAGRLAVENFIHQHADLAVELDMLLNTKFSPEIIEFADKENLIRTEGSNINETNHEEYFLLYIDNELSTAKREEVEMYVLQHPKLQDEFITLKQAVLAPEVINYGDKTDLYRTKKRRAIYLTPWRMAAAAIFIGVCAVGVWLTQKPADVPIPVAVNTPVEKLSGQNNPEATPADTIQQQPQPKKPVIAVQSVPKKENKNVTDKSAHRSTKDDQQQVAVERPVIKHNNIIPQQKEPPAELHDLADVPERIGQKQNHVAVAETPATEINSENYTVYPVAYKELNTNDEDRSLHVGILDLNKDKVKTLFKKAGRMFGNKSNDFSNEDGKLQIANFEIETKKQ